MSVDVNADPNVDTEGSRIVLPLLCTGELKICATPRQWFYYSITLEIIRVHVNLNVFCSNHHDHLFTKWSTKNIRNIYGCVISAKAIKHTMSHKTYYGVGEILTNLKKCESYW